MDILQVTEELELLLETGIRVPGFRKKVLVDTDRLSELGGELRAAVPANIQEAQEILKQKESIINQAYLEAQRIRNEADQEADEVKTVAQQEHHLKVDETEIVKAAEAKSQEIKDEAMMESALILQDTQRRAYEVQTEAEAIAANRRDGADAYAREVLCNLEEQLANSLGQVRKGIDALRAGEDIRGPAREPVREQVQVQVPA
ncbi:MAG: hypothetical protein IH956_04340 [Chloroflexi bacterium]|nr:hypothetical protein [Chloroflexota bacterium]